MGRVFVAVAQMAEYRVGSVSRNGEPSIPEWISDNEECYISLVCSFKNLIT